jgi:hypothetical protein
VSNWGESQSRPIILSTEKDWAGRKKKQNTKGQKDNRQNATAGEMSINIRPATKEDALFLGWVVVHAAQSHLEWGFFEAELYVLHLSTIAPEARECRPLRCLAQACSLAATLPLA